MSLAGARLGWDWPLRVGGLVFPDGSVTNLEIEHPDTLGEQAFKNLRDSLLGWLKVREGHLIL